MSLIFDIPCDYASAQAAISLAIRDLRWSFVYRYDDLVPGWCEWAILAPLSQEEKGVIRLRKLGKGVRLSIPAIPEIANILVPRLQSSGIPLRPREQMLFLGRSEAEDQGGPDPCDVIPEGWQREAVRLWRQGYTATEIGRMLKYNSKTVANKLSELRQVYGEEVVPTDTQRRRRLRK